MTLLLHKTARYKLYSIITHAHFFSQTHTSFQWNYIQFKIELIKVLCLQLNIYIFIYLRHQQLK